MRLSTIFSPGAALICFLLVIFSATSAAAFQQQTKRRIIVNGESETPSVPEKKQTGKTTASVKESAPAPDVTSEPDEQSKSSESVKTGLKRSLKVTGNSDIEVASESGGSTLKPQTEDLAEINRRAEKTENPNLLRKSSAGETSSEQKDYLNETASSDTARKGGTNSSANNERSNRPPSRIRKNTDSGERTSLQVNGLFGDDDLDQSDIAELKSLDVNTQARFFISGSDEETAVSADELAADGRTDAVRADPKNALNPAATGSAGLNAKDLVSFSGGGDFAASGQENSRSLNKNRVVRTVITTTTVRSAGQNYPSLNLPSGDFTVSSSRTSRVLPAQYASWILYYGRANNVDPLLILEVMRQESSFNPRAGSPVGAKGLMQFMDATGARFGITNPYDPQQSIRAGAEYLSFLLRRYGGNVFSALAGYNAGEGAVDCFLTGRSMRLRNGKVINRRGAVTQHGIPPYAETQNYVRTITSKYFALKRKMGQGL